MAHDSLGSKRYHEVRNFRCVEMHRHIFKENISSHLCSSQCVYFRILQKARLECCVPLREVPAGCKSDQGGNAKRAAPSHGHPPLDPCIAPVTVSLHEGRLFVDINFLPVLQMLHRKIPRWYGCSTSLRGHTCACADPTVYLHYRQQGYEKPVASYCSCRILSYAKPV